MAEDEVRRVSKVWMLCDRCNNEVLGYDFWSRFGTPYSVGFYRFFDAKGEDTIWAPFRRGLEEVVCRDCMWSDTAFLAKYPWIGDRKVREMIVRAAMA